MKGAVVRMANGGAEVVLTVVPLVELGVQVTFAVAPFSRCSCHCASPPDRPSVGSFWILLIVASTAPFTV